MTATILCWIIKLDILQEVNIIQNKNEMKSMFSYAEMFITTPL